MSKDDKGAWCPFRPGAGELKAIADDVAEIAAIQKRILDNHKHLQFPDRVAHQYQIAGGKVRLTVAGRLPPELTGIGLFVPGSTYLGIGRVSTGLGTPHLETNPDFLGLRLAFQTKAGQRIDFLAINDPTAPTDNHRDFVSLLHATAEAAGAEIPLLGAWGDYDVLNLIAEQKELVGALKRRMGWKKAGMTAFHITQQTLRTFQSSTAWQTYWTGISEAGGTVGKFTLVPARDENTRPGIRPGERHLSEDWKRRQKPGDIAFGLYWIPWLDEARTSTAELTEPWVEDHKQRVGEVVFPAADLDSDAARLWAALANEMGANPGNWVRDTGDTIREPATPFETARKLAYALSQKGRDVLDEALYRDVFTTGEIGPALAQELRRRVDAKAKAGHVSAASAG
jgi:hypothetical protein